MISWLYPFTLRLLQTKPYVPKKRLDTLKAPYSSRTDVLLSKKVQLIDIWYKYNHKVWHLTACKILVSLSFLKQNDVRLMLPTLIQRYDKNHFTFKRLTEILQAVRGHIL